MSEPPHSSAKMAMTPAAVELQAVDSVLAR